MLTEEQKVKVYCTPFECALVLNFLIAYEANFINDLSKRSCIFPIAVNIYFYTPRHRFQTD